MKTTITILLATMFTVGTVMAEPEQRGRKSPRGDRLSPQVIEQLGLTAEQQTALKEAKNAMQLQTIDLKAELQKAKHTMRNIADSDDVNRDDIMAAVEAEAAAELALKKARIDHMLQVREIIGAEKAKELRELMKKSRGKDGKRERRDRRSRDDDSSSEDREEIRN